MANWSELPIDLLEYLTSFLSLPDYHRFGAVCQNWWSVAKQKHSRPANQLPWLVLGDDYATQKRTFFNLLENKHYCIDIPELRGQYLCGSFYGWLFTIDIQLNARLLNPFTGKQYDLPPLPAYSEYFKTHAYLREPTEHSTATFAEMQMKLVWKAILDYDPSDRSDFKVVIVYGENRVLAFWRPGDLKWKFIDGYWYIDDVLFSNGKLYTITSMGDSRLNVVDDWSAPKLTQVKVTIPTIFDVMCFSYLVDIRGELLLVQRYREYNVVEQHHTTIDVQVRKIDVDGGVSVACKHIEGYAIFLGNSLPVVVDPSKFPSCRKNTIYFTDISFTLNAPKYGRDDFWIYDMNTCRLSRYYPCNIFIPPVAAPIWFNPNPW
ncbi:F-box family protein [Rhynchospora pubera]|uniref:F-box family protein n=1 Tax=Rhynchospora pubera TaxID=906938 RepID=A0AAV8G1F1_9POAL|nr:F-box family protein [Rhynchospora pubera]